MLVARSRLGPHRGAFLLFLIRLGSEVEPRPSSRRRICVGAVSLAVSLVLASCAGLSHGQVFQVTIKNDTAGSVVVRSVGGSLTFDLASGQGVQINRVAGHHDYYSLSNRAGAQLGCIDLYFQQPAPEASVSVTNAVACPAGSGIPVWVFVAIVAALFLLATWFWAARRP